MPHQARAICYLAVDPSVDAELRKLVFAHGLPTWTVEDSYARLGDEVSSSLRVRVWKCLLGTTAYLNQHGNALNWFRLMESLGPCEFSDEIERDVHRTLRRCKSYPLLVPDEDLSRMMNVLTWGVQHLNDQDAALRRDCAAEEKPLLGTAYVQGMCRVLGFFALLMPPLDATVSACASRCRFFPEWWGSEKLSAITDACQVVKKIVQQVDEPLFHALNEATAPLHDWTRIACWQPFTALFVIPSSDESLSEVVSVWDCMLAMGGHLFPLMCAAKLISMRDELLEAAKPFAVDAPASSRRAARDLVRKILANVFEDGFSARELIGGAAELAGVVSPEILTEAISLCVGSKDLQLRIRAAGAHQSRAAAVARDVVVLPASSTSTPTSGSRRGGTPHKYEVLKSKSSTVTSASRVAQSIAKTLQRALKESSGASARTRREVAIDKVRAEEVSIERLVRRVGVPLGRSFPSRSSRDTKPALSVHKPAATTTARLPQARTDIPVWTSEP
jgi:hypothetical protein